jgi:hypothetical protein
MSLSQTPILSGTSLSNFSHVHVAAENCPTCDQPIPHDRLEEIKEKIQARQSAQATQIAARIQEQFKREKADALEQAAREAAITLATTVASARDDERQTADAAANQKLADAERANNDAQAALQTRIDQAEVAKSAAEQSGNALRAELDQTRLDHEATIQKVRQEAEASAVKQAEAAVQERIAGMERSRQESEAALQSRITEAEVAKSAAEQSGNALRAELDQTRLDHEATIQKVRQEAEASAVKQAEAAIQEKIAGMEHTRQESEAALQARITEAEVAKDAAQNANAGLLTQIEQMRTDGEAAIEKTKQDAEMRVNAVRQETAASAEAAMQEKIAGAEQAKADAEARALASEQQVHTLKESHEADVVQRLNEQREVLEKAKTDAVNAEKSTSFQKELKLQSKVDEIQRALDNKTAEELGEGAEIDLYEVLKGEFEGDKIERINKGQPGADILHTVIHNGKECGSIIYDSKNHNAWRNDFLTKLASDQMAAKAEHAVLSTRKFPAGTRHLHVQDGVILAAPSRVLALVQILRQHIVQTHTLRWSDEARTQKTAALYAFINSERCRDLFKRIDTQAEKLLDLQVKEKKAHESTWKTQGELIRSVQKVQAEICNEIDTIVGTAETLEQAVHE